MRATRRFWAVAGAGGLLVAAALVLAQPRLLIGAAGIGAWLSAYQLLFVRELRRADGALRVEQTVAPEQVTTDEAAEATLAVELPRATSLSLAVEAGPPVGARVEGDRSVTLSGEGDASTTYALAAPVAGTMAFEPATVTARDRAGLFVESFERGTAPSATVVPRAPRNVHVGRGGEEVAVAYGEHDAGRRGSGLEPAEVREYVAGDAASRIDWKATARLDHPHVREFEAETDRTTALVVDHRATMAAGREGERKLDYATEVALAFVASARELGDPLGLYTVGDGGTTSHSMPAATPDQYSRLRTRLLDLEPTADEDGGRTPGRARPPASARRAADALANDDSAFGRALRPYFEDADTYVERIADDPLFGTVSTQLTRLRGTLWTALVTDDANRAELRETVKLARRGGDNVLVFLAPSALFEAGGLADLEAAYDSYRDFESFRRDLDRLDRVSAFEVAPGDRLDAILAARRERRQATGGVR